MKDKALPISSLALVALIPLLSVVISLEGRAAPTPLSTIPITSAVTAVDHDNGIYVVGTAAGQLYVIDEAGNYTVTSLGTGRIDDVRIENRFIAVAMRDKWVIELELKALPDLTPTVLWEQTPDGTHVPSVDLSSDGTYVAYVSRYGSVGVYDKSGNLVASYSKAGCDMAAWLDATADMEYIAITMEVGATAAECAGINTGVELYRFDGSTLQYVWGKILTYQYETTEVRISESKDYVAAATSSGTVMNLLDFTGDVVGTYDAGAEQYAVDGDDDLEYVIGGTVTSPYRYLVLKNLGGGPNYLVLVDDNPMIGPLDSSAQIDSNPDCFCVAFGSDGGDFILLRRTDDTFSTALSGSVAAPIGAVEVGDRTLLVASADAIGLYPGCAPLYKVPALTQWGLIILATLLIGISLSWMAIRRGRRRANAGN